jgi:GxxExxY protein
MHPTPLRKRVLGKQVQTEIDAVTYQVVGCAMAIHNALDPGSKEATYHHALHAAMITAGLTCEEEVPVEIHLNDSSVGLLILITSLVAR